MRGVIDNHERKKVDRGSHKHNAGRVILLRALLASRTKRLYRNIVVRTEEARNIAKVVLVGIGVAVYLTYGLYYFGMGVLPYYSNWLAAIFMWGNIGVLITLVSWLKYDPTADFLKSYRKSLRH